MTGGSQQARILRRALRDGASLADAAEAAGMSLDEARLQQREEERNPPPAEAFELIGAGERRAAISTTSDGATLDPFVPRAEENEMPKPDIDNNDHDAEFDPLIELAAGTLRGDVRDSLLGWFKAQPKAWPFLSEREQRDLADAADRFAEQLVKQACEIIAAGERPCIVAKLTEYKEKDGVEAKLKLASKGEIVAALHEAVGKEVLIVTSGAEEFNQEGGPAEIDADQPKFPNLDADGFDEAA